MKHLATIFFGILLAVAGLVAGRMLAAPPPKPAVSHGPACEHGGVPAPTGDTGPRVFAPQTLQTMGVQVGPAVRGSFVLTQPVQAVIADRPLNRLPVVAPLGGIVLDVHVETGQVAENGITLVTISRDPIPRPKPELTAELLKPISEEVHAAASRLRTARSEIAVTRQEIERIRPFVEKRTVSAKDAVELQYRLARSEQQVANVRAELKAHGLTEEEIDRVAAGGSLPRTPQLWQHALLENGLWTEASGAVWSAIPELQRELPWCVAAVGELTAAGLATPELATLLQNDEHARNHFAQIAGLLLQGFPLTTVRVLLDAGALEPQMRVRAPHHGAPDWDVQEILVRPGQRVAAGETLVELYDAREMWLRLQPIGEEIGAVTRAIADGAPLTARPLITGSGPELHQVRLQRLALQGRGDDRGGLATALVENVPYQCGPGVTCRSWQLRVGLRYLVEVPVERWERRFVLPADAVTATGPDRVVFVQDGDTFRAQPVHVEYADDRTVVVADDGSIYEGDPIVLQGAFALGLALQTGPAKADPHAGHSHQ